MEAALFLELSTSIYLTMLKNYFKVAYRNLLKNKVFSLVNIFGLAIGMSACFFIFLYVHFELSYDRFHKNADNLYRVPITVTGNISNVSTQATNHPAVGPAMKQEFPEVIDFARAAPLHLVMNASMVSYTEGSRTTTFNEDRIWMADPSFLTMFSFPFVVGDPKTALTGGHSIVISNSTARKYFGNENPLGKTLSLNRETPFKVTGVFKDIPQNSHLKFDMLTSFQMLQFTVFKLLDPGNYLDNTWIWPEFYTYVQLAPGTDPQKLEAKLPAFVAKHLGDEMKKLDYTCQFHLQPIRDIHLKSEYSTEAEANGSEKEVYFLSIIGVFILVIAWINYINLSTAKSIERAREVGLRKVVGAGRIQLIVQFITESAIINFLALGVAAIIVWSGYPLFSQITGKNISDQFSDSGLLQQPIFWLSLAGAFASGTFLVGAYPAFILSAFRPVFVLKGRLFQSNKGIMLRKSLVSFQFILSILLIAAAFTLHSQLSYMRQQSLGYSKDQVLVLKAPAIYDSTISDKMAAFKNELLKSHAVTDVSVSTEIPGKTIVERNTVRKLSDNATFNFAPPLVAIDDHFINTYKIGMAAGRGFLPGESSAISKTEVARVIVNEEVVKALGYKNNQAAINQPVIFTYRMDDIHAEIIGVIKNYHQRSLKESYDPILYYYPKDAHWSYISIHLNTDHLSQDMASFENVYKTIFTGNAFEYFFLNDYFNRQYQDDQRFGDIFSLFTGLAIFVACLGLLGLSSFIIRLRTREIGVRKVLGASVYSLLVLFSSEFVKLVCFAAVITTPIIYYLANRWLDNYAFHIRLSWVIFVLPPLLLLVISLITISLHSVKAALANPVKSIKSE
jgi:putative ABC transport system permease protein